MTELCPGTATTKRFSNEVLNWSISAKINLIWGLFSGDGCKHNHPNIKGAMTLITASDFLASQIRTILCQIGITSTGGKYSNADGPTIRNKNKISELWSNRIELNRTEATKLFEYVKDIEYIKNIDISSKFSEAYKDNEGSSTNAIWNGFLIGHITNVSITESKEITVYNLEVDEDNSYVANGIGVHNCSCIKERKTRKISDKNVKCLYHKNGGSEDCPRCGCKKGETKKFAVEDLPAFEYNYGVKFIENSFVVNPACHDCGVTEVIDPQEFMNKVSAIAAKLPSLLKAAASQDIMCTEKACIKLAGQKELDQLNQALELMTTVAQSMLKQKDQLDLEFLSDLVEVVANLQTVTDELNQQGYGRLQSPPETPGEEQPPSTTTPQTPSSGGANSGIPGMNPMKPTPGGGSKIQTGTAGEAGTVTSPMASRRFNISKLGQFLSKKRNFLVNSMFLDKKKNLKINPKIFEKI